MKPEWAAVSGTLRPPSPCPWWSLTLRSVGAWSQVSSSVSRQEERQEIWSYALLLQPGA